MFNNICTFLIQRTQFQVTQVIAHISKRLATDGAAQYAEKTETITRSAFHYLPGAHTKRMV